MKRIYLIIILSVICGLTAMAQDRPDLTHQTGGGDHIGIGIFSVEMPTVEYNDVTHLLTITCNGSSEYYTVEIVNTINNQVVFSTEIGGTGGVIDATPFLDGIYNIRITDTEGHQFIYTFDGAVHAVGKGFIPNHKGVSFIDRHQLK